MTGQTQMDTAEILALRGRHLGGSLSLSYRRPLHIVRGEGQFLFDSEGRPYLDCVNNVCHVGHCHPRVVEAARAQMSALNTNTRYLHENVVEYARRLSGTMPDPLEVCFFVCSGSEANELALRLARTATGRRDVVVLDGAYHGNTGGMVELSPYKFDGAGGSGRPDHVHVAPAPDPYRGPWPAADRDAGERYAATVAARLEEAASSARPAAAFFAESVPGCAGQIVPPAGYLRSAFDHARAFGALAVADEVQVGFGRVGTHWWGFEAQGALPDIVTLGKPIGNGHPMGAVVTTRAVAEAFDNGMEYFNTFGGNPVSSAIGLAVLDVIEDEGLRENAATVGEAFRSGLRELQALHPLIGDVRGMGLFIGVELVRDPESKAPATDEASEIVNEMKERGILLSTDGPFENVIKIKPPLVFTAADADRVVGELGDVLSGGPCSAA
jgi:4-aminobutyrate aminotransferase-like enzyme